MGALHVQPEGHPGGGGGPGHGEEVLGRHILSQGQPQLGGLHRELCIHSGPTHVIQQRLVVVHHGAGLLPGVHILPQHGEDTPDPQLPHGGGRLHRRFHALPGHEAVHAPADEGEPRKPLASRGAAGKGQQRAADHAGASREKGLRETGGSRWRARAAAASPTADETLKPWPEQALSNTTRGEAGRRPILHRSSGAFV